MSDDVKQPTGVALSPSVIKAIDKLAKREERSRSWMIERILKDRIEEEERKTLQDASR